MKFIPWFERFPVRLKYELDELEQIGVVCKPNPEALLAGRIVLAFDMQIGGDKIHLVVKFPEFYPYFRFEVEAPHENLKYHQNPLLKNLCLLGRRTEYWNTNDTAAALLSEQLPKLIKAEQTESVELSRGLELQQAEPVSEYFPYVEGIILVSSEWKFEDARKYGQLFVRIDNSFRSPSTPLRGLVEKVNDSTGKPLFSAGISSQATFEGPLLRGRWDRLSDPIIEREPQQFLDALLDTRPTARNNPPNVLDNGGKLWLWAIVFPEEIGHRKMGEGWMFVCMYDGPEVRRLKQKGR